MKIRYKFLYNISLLGLIHRGSHNTKIIKTSIYVRWSILKSIFEFYMIKETDFITVSKQMQILYIFTFLMVWYNTRWQPLKNHMMALKMSFNNIHQNPSKKN